MDAGSGAVLLVSIAKRPIERLTGGLESIIEEKFPFRFRLDSECYSSVLGRRGTFNNQIIVGTLNDVLLDGSMNNTYSGETGS